MSMIRLRKDLEDQIQDEQDHPWYCNLHNKDAVQNLLGTGPGWRCPDCNKYIEDAWEERQETGEFGDRFWL